MDADGIDNNIEDAAPNNDDGNGDATPDSEQKTVTSLSLQATNQYVTLEIISTCPELEAVDEANVETGEDYIFPFGAVEFTVPCSSAEVKLYFHGAGDLTGYNYRKLRANNTWFNYQNATFGSEIIDGETVATVTLNLTDGGPEDYDGEVNGSIHDPGGPALLAPDSTIPIWDWWHMIILGIVLGGYFAFRKTPNTA